MASITLSTLSTRTWNKNEYRPALGFPTFPAMNTGTEGAGLDVFPGDTTRLLFVPALSVRFVAIQSHIYARQLALGELQFNSCKRPTNGQQANDTSALGRSL